MPSPLGHALGGAAAAWLAGGRLREGLHAEAILFGSVAMLPDLDLMVGAHSTYTHSIGAVILAAGLALSLTRGRAPWLAVGVAAAWSSHILLDWLGSDTSPPIGIMALWPFTREFYQSPFFVFMAITRRWWLPQFYTWNVVAALREMAILGPIALIVGVWRGHRP